MRTLNTSRLTLVPASLELIEAELDSHVRLASALGARVPDSWPPGEYDRRAIEFFRDRLSEKPETAGWYGWYAILPAAVGEPATLIGSGGFLGPPAADQVVEVGYSVVTTYEARGFATEIVRALVDHAFSTGRVRRIIAHTSTNNAGSIGVLEKSGFQLAGPGPEPGTVKYERRMESDSAKGT